MDTSQTIPLTKWATLFSCHLHTAKKDASLQAGFHTFHEREAFRGLPQLRHDDVMLPEDVYEDLVPVLRKDVRAQWQQRMEAFCGEKGERMKNQSVILVLGLLLGNDYVSMCL